MKFASVLFFWVLLLILFQACENDSIPHISGPPAITIDAPSVYRQTVDLNFEFEISIPQASVSDVSVDYVTKDGTAVAGVDFISTSGTATILAGELSTRVYVKVKGDSLRRDFQFFYLELSNLGNCTVANTEAMAVIENSDGLYLPIDNAGYSTPDSYPDYTLVWNDEFNGESIDENNWGYDIGNSGWGTQELEYYTNRTQNAFVSSGNLILEARREYRNGSAFTSARLTTKSKKSFMYGRIDIRAKVPCSQGIMASLWMLGSNVDAVEWPACGEIDIMQLPHTENYVYNTIHWGDSPAAPNQFGFNQPLGTLDNTFHVFTVVWDANQITMYIDDVSSFQKSTSEGSLPFNHDFFFIFNLAVGGQWPGSPDATTPFPQRMVVDYVRVFQ